jgi:hypothetical protein
MMKKIYAFILILLYINHVSIAQSAFQISNSVGSIITNTTVSVSVDYFDQVSYIMDVKNISTASKNIKMKKEIITDLAGTNIAMCSGSVCYSPSTIITPTAVQLNPNSTLLSQNDEYHAVFQPFGTLGSAVAKYTVFEVGGNDSVFVIFNFNSQVLSVKNINTNKILNVYYYNKQLVIDNEGEKNYSLEVYNLTGEKIESINNNSNVMRVYLPSNQMYLIKYTLDNKVYTKKIIAN